MQYPGEPCPRCGEPVMRPLMVMNSLSRIDNNTYICPPCGRDEAIENLAGRLLRDKADWHDPTGGRFREPF